MIGTTFLNKILRNLASKLGYFAKIIKLGPFWPKNDSFWSLIVYFSWVFEGWATFKSCVILISLIVDQSGVGKLRKVKVHDKNVNILAFPLTLPISIERKFALNMWIFLNLLLYFMKMFMGNWSKSFFECRNQVLE